MSRTRPRFVERIARIFLTGLLALLPLGLTLFVLGWIVGILYDFAGPGSRLGRMLTSAGLSFVANEVLAYSLGVLVVVLLVFGLGILSEISIVNRWHGLVDRALQRVPVFGMLYEAAKQVTGLFHRKPDSLQGMTPVMCYFGDDCSIGTPALMPTAELVRLEGNEYHVVILPTAPVPFGGALLLVKAQWVKPANCGFEELVGIYVSMGVTAPNSLGRGAVAETPYPPVEASAPREIGS